MDFTADIIDGPSRGYSSQVSKPFELAGQLYIGVAVTRHINSSEPLGIVLHDIDSALRLAALILDAAAKASGDQRPPNLTSEVDTLAHEIAYCDAKDEIEAFCQSRVGWGYDVSSVPDLYSDWVKRAVRYLELRGLLHRHPHNPNFVRVLAISEEAAR